MDPNIWNVVIKDFSDFIDDARGELRRDFARGNPASHSLNLAFFSQIERFDLPRVHLSQRDKTTAKRCKASLDDFDVRGW